MQSIFCGYSIEPFSHLVRLNTCQITVQSDSSPCLARLCYPGSCDRFPDVNSTINFQNTSDVVTATNDLGSSIYHIPWSTMVNTTRTQWTFWIDRTGLTMQHGIVVLLALLNMFLTSMTVLSVIKSVRYANMIAGRKAYRYTLL